MVRWWNSTKPVSEPQFESHQQKLQRMSAEVVQRYQRELDAEISDPQRLSATYGSAFAGAETRRQTQTVVMMAASMLKVPNADAMLVMSDRQESVAAVRDYEIVDPGDANAPIHDSYCKHVIGTGREFAVDDAPNHPLVCDTSFARGRNIIAYLGVPIASRDGVIVGVLCVHDSRAREWRVADVSMLTQLSFVLTRAMEPAEPVSS